MSNPVTSRKPVLAILGYGRCGKDTCGQWLGEHTPLVYAGSSSNVVVDLIAADLGVTPEEAWADRHRNRAYWKQWADNYRKDDPTKLARLCLQRGDLIIGLRDVVEFRACRDANLFDIAIWVNRDVPVDPTVTFSRDDCDIVVDNNSDLDTLARRLKNLCTFAGIHVF